MFHRNNIFAIASLFLFAFLKPEVTFAKPSPHHFSLRTSLVQSRLIRSDSSSSTGTFSILSNTGILADLSYGYALFKGWNSYIDVGAISYTYAGPSSRTFTDIDQSTIQFGWTNEISYRYVKLFLTLQNRSLIVLTEQTAASYLVDKVDIQQANIGMKLTARAKGFDLHAVGYVVVPATTPLYNDTDLTTLESSLHGDFLIRFGKQFKYGINFIYQLDNYKIATSSYTVSHLGMGFFAHYGF